MCNHLSIGMQNEREGFNESRANKLGNMPVIDLTAPKARIARHAKINAIKALDFIVSELEKGNAGELAYICFGVSTSRQQKELADNYRKVSEFLKRFDDQGFKYDNRGANLFAYVYPQDKQKIYLCGLFFDKRTPDYGRDSKMGTIIHEATHLVLGTKDYGYGDGLINALARYDNKKYSRGNADNWEALPELRY